MYCLEVEEHLPKFYNRLLKFCTLLYFGAKETSTSGQETFSFLLVPEPEALFLLSFFITIKSCVIALKQTCSRDKSCQLSYICPESWRIVLKFCIHLL